MKLTFLGTGADSSYPLPSCRCEYCLKSREYGGKNLRKRALAVINEDLILDFGPDMMSASFMYGIDISKLKYCYITHAHADHFDPAHLSTRIPDYAAENTILLEIYASQLSLERMTKMLMDIGYISDIENKKEQEKLNIRSIKAIHSKKIEVGDYTVIPFSSNHDESVGSVVYAITQNEKSILYCTDTDSLSDTTWGAMVSNSCKFDLIVLDHTYGFNIEGGGHLNGNKFVDHIQKFKSLELLKPSARIMATHISHEGNPPHEEMQQLANRYGYEVAYDGLFIDL